MTKWYGFDDNQDVFYLGDDSSAINTVELLGSYGIYQGYMRVFAEYEIKKLAAGLLEALDAKVIVEVRSGVADAEGPDYIPVEVRDYDGEDALVCAECGEEYWDDPEGLKQCERCNSYVCESDRLEYHDGYLCPYCAKALHIITNLDTLKGMFRELFIDTEKGRPDYPARREAWNDWTDGLYTDGEITTSLYNESLPDEWDDD